MCGILIAIQPNRMNATSLPPSGTPASQSVQSVTLDIDALIAQFESVPPTFRRHHRRGDSSTDAHPERRQAPRSSVADLDGDVRLSLGSGHAAALINVSRSGVLLETTYRLCPGRTVDVFVRLRDQRLAMKAVVVRCHVQALAPPATYRAALLFEGSLPIPERAA